ncbi:reverse transcriptase domain-containing protein [Tanacetum coccineum]
MFEYILVTVDYVSKWAEAQALPTNDARVVITFLKKLFCQFGMPKALISDRGTHFSNKIMEKTMKRDGVNHHFSTSYHPQTSGQVENTNKALKRILEKTVKDNLAIWSRKLDDAPWAFRTAYKTPTNITPYKLVYGKNYHLPFEIKHRAYWALKNCYPDLIAAREKQMFQLHKLYELRHQAYDNSRLYKATTKSAQCISVITPNNVVDKSLTAELATYKEQVELYERQAKFELTEREQKIDEQLRIVITDRNIKEENLKRELHSVKMQLNSTINHNKSMVEEGKVAIGYKNPFYLSNEKQVQPSLYSGQEIVKPNYARVLVHDSEDTLEIAETTRKQMNEKMKDP